MQRVVSINLNGNVYQLEENGYNALFAYLDAYDAQLKDNPNRTQLLAELEARMAEMCKACLAPHKNVVTSLEIDRLLGELGPIPGQPGASAASQSAGAAGSASEQSSASTSSTSSSSSGSSTSSTSSTSSDSPTSSTGPFTHRRLYQIREGSMISGVCMGLSEYMHVDVTFIRIMFVFFALMTGGWGILAYAVMMLVVPRVETRAGAASLDASGVIPPHRWPWDDGWPWDKHGWPWEKQGWPWDHPKGPQGNNARQQAVDARQQVRDARQQARDARRAWRDERRAARAAYYPAGQWPGMFFMIMAVVFAFFWLSMWTRGRIFFGWPYFWGFPHWVGIVIFFMVMRFIFMPWPRWHGPYAPPHYGWIAMWNGLAWFSLMLFGIWVCYHYIPEFRDFMRQTGFDYRYRL